MTIERTQSPNPSLHARPNGYVPPAGDADGNEDPTPVTVADSSAPAQSPTRSLSSAPREPEDDAEGERSGAEEISFDQLSGASRRIGQLPKTPESEEAGRPDIAGAVAQSLRAPALTDMPGSK
ncbi:MAG: hypothetical protein NVSMB6_22910 [Burkholderiaceae bacterium]